MKPELWTSWRDRRDGTVVTVVRVRHWDARFALLPDRGQGAVDVVAEGGPRERWPRKCFVRQHEFEDHFELIYDPHTGFDAAAA